MANVKKVKTGKISKIIRKSDKLTDMSKALSTLSSIKNIDFIKKEYDLSEEHLTPTVVLHKMSEILELYLKIIQQILQPEEFHALYEANAFDDKDKVGLFDLYKRIIIAHRELLKTLVLADEKDTLSTIQFIHSELQDVKPQMLEIVKKMQQSWKTDAKKDGSRGTRQYFG